MPDSDLEHCHVITAARIHIAAVEHLYTKYWPFLVKDAAPAVEVAVNDIIKNIISPLISFQYNMIL